MGNDFKNELIPLTQNKEGGVAVSAKELYEFLGFDKSNWAKWYKKNILENDFATEGVDYQLLVLSTSENVRGNFAQDFALSITFAKKIAMMSRTERGEQARDYFIECEQRLHNQNKSMTHLEVLRSVIDQAIETEKRLKQVESNQFKHEERLNDIEDKMRYVDEVIPLSENDIQENQNLRQTVNHLVHKYASLSGKDHSRIWVSIYDDLFYRYRHKVVLTKEDVKNKVKKIDKADKMGLIPMMYDIISSYFPKDLK